MKVLGKHNIKCAVVWRAYRTFSQSTGGAVDRRRSDGSAPSTAGKHRAFR